jgi:hypothetical protein
MAVLSICSAGPEMDVRIRHRVATLGGAVQRVQLYPSHHEFVITVPDDKLQELLDWRTTLMGGLSLGTLLPAESFVPGR